MSQRNSLQHRIASQLLRSSAIADRGWKAWEVMREEVALALCDEQTRGFVTADVYRRKDQYWEGSAHNRDGLFAFERAAIERFFPPPPARVLVGACGGGREVLALAAAGYQISAAYDPSSRLLTALQRELAIRDTSTISWIGTHEDLSTFAAAHTLGRVDAVVVGWGSFAHVLGGPRRVGFLKAVREICPDGPVLISYFAANPSGEARGRAKFRRGVRALLHRLPGLPRARVEDGDSYDPVGGFSHWFTDDELHAEASAAEYEIAHLADPDQAFPHAVLRPKPAS